MTSFGWPRACCSFYAASASDGANLVFYLLIGTIPALIAGYLVETYVGNSFRSMKLVAWTMTGFAIVLYAADKFGLTVRRLEHITVGHAIVIGLAQAVAFIPGTSRSGITMVAARLLGYRAGRGGAVFIPVVDSRDCRRGHLEGPQGSGDRLSEDAA